MIRTALFCLLLIVPAFSAVTLHIDTLKGADDYADSEDTLFVSGGGDWAGNVDYVRIFLFKDGTYIGVYNNNRPNNITIDDGNDTLYGYIYGLGTIAVSDSVDSIIVRVADDDFSAHSADTDYLKTDNIPPATIAPMTAVPRPIDGDSNNVKITFQWPKENGSTGGAVSSMTIKYASSVIDNLTKWNSATDLPCAEPSVKAPGTLESNYECDMWDVGPGTYYYAIRTTDNMGYESGLAYETSGAKTKPVELAAFTATRQGNAVELYWMTESEVDNLKWRLKRSSNAEGSYTVIYEEAKAAGEMTTAYQSEYYYLDTDVDENELCYYILEDIDTRGYVTAHGPIPVGGGLKDGEHAADRITLDQNTPNPMARGTATFFHYYIPQFVLDTGDGKAVLGIYTASGEEIARMTDETPFAGINTARLWWDGRDSAGQLMPEGLYIYKLYISYHEAAGQLMIIR